MASLDLVALAIFVWQAVSEELDGPTNSANATSPAPVVRLWFAMTLRQICLLVVAALTLLHVRMGRSVSFGAKHWMLWSPTLLLIVVDSRCHVRFSHHTSRPLFITLQYTLVT